MARNIIRLAVILLVVHALYRFVPIYVHYQEFKDAVNEAAMFSKDRSEAQIADLVMELAAKYQVPLDRDAVSVRREQHHTYIDASYVEQVQWLPGYRRPQKFTIAADALDVR